MGRRGHSGRTQTPCQGEGHGFESRLPLRNSRWKAVFNPTKTDRHPMRDAAWSSPRQLISTSAATDLRPAELGVWSIDDHDVATHRRTRLHRATIWGSSENGEVDPAIGRIVPAAIIPMRSAWSRTPSACDGSSIRFAFEFERILGVCVADAYEREVAEQHWSRHDAVVLASIPDTKPTSRCRPPKAMHRNVSTVVAPPTLSKATSTPRPPVASRTRATKSSLR